MLLLEKSIEKKKKEHWNLYIDSFLEPYASKGACTVRKGTNLTLINRLSHQRFLFVGDDIDPESANHAVGLITIYGIENKEEIIHCYINSNGGSAIGGLAIFASVTTGIAPVHTICVGTAISMASFILSGGVSTKRLAFPHARRQ